MGSPKRNFNTGYQIVKQNFQDSIASLFEKQHHGTACNNVIINILFCALCRTRKKISAPSANSVGDVKVLWESASRTILKTGPNWTFAQWRFSTLVHRKCALIIVLLPWQ